MDFVDRRFPLVGGARDENSCWVPSLPALRRVPEGVTVKYRCTGGG